MESITQDYEALMQLIDEAGGDITGAEEALDKWFEQIEGALEDKTDAYVSVMRELEARAEWRKTEAKRLTDKAKRDEKNVAGIKGRLLCYMQRLNKTTIETPFASVWLVAEAKLPFASLFVHVTVFPAVATGLLFAFGLFRPGPHARPSCHGTGARFVGEVGRRSMVPDASQFAMVSILPRSGSNASTVRRFLPRSAFLCRAII
jgi:hypothetical protein